MDCAAAGPAVSDLIDDYQDFVVIEYHVNDPPYATPWGDARAVDFYDIFSGFLPWFGFDGLFNAGYDWLNYEPQLQQRLTVTTDVTLTISGVEVAADTYDITAEVCVEVGGVGKTMRLYIAQLLDNYPPTELYYRNSFMQAAPTEDVILAAGQCAQVVRTFTFGADSMAQIEDVKIVAWAQEPLDFYPAEVHQAIESPWPFIGPAIFSDGFESGGVAGWSGTNP